MNALSSPPLPFFPKIAEGVSKKKHFFLFFLVEQTDFTREIYFYVSKVCLPIKGFFCPLRVFFFSKDLLLFLG